MTTHCFLRTQVLAFVFALILLPSGVCSAGAGSDLQRGFRGRPSRPSPGSTGTGSATTSPRKASPATWKPWPASASARRLIGNMDLNDNARGSVKVLTEEWWGMVEHAIREGGRLGVNIGMFNCPGWSQSGGPWIKPEQTMRYVAISETRVKGPAKFEGKLPAPEGAVSGYRGARLPRAAERCGHGCARRRPRITCRPEAEECGQPVRRAVLTPSALFPADAAVKEPFVRRHRADRSRSRPAAWCSTRQPCRSRVDCELQAARGRRQFQTVRKFDSGPLQPGAQRRLHAVRPGGGRLSAGTAKQFPARVHQPAKATAAWPRSN